MVSPKDEAPKSMDMEKKVLREIRSIEELPEKLTIVLDHVTRRTILEFAIFFYTMAILMSLYLVYEYSGESIPIWMAIASVTGVFILFTVLLFCITITHFMHLDKFGF